jgi:hypothetical protein
MAYLFWTVYGLVAAAPLICLVFLARRFSRGTDLHEAGMWGIYLGCLMWFPPLAAHAAIHPGWRAVLGFPFFFGAALGAVWRLQSVPRSRGLSIFVEAGFYASMGLLAYVALGGGYFDRVIQTAHARKMLQKTGVRADDLVGVTRSLDNEDMYTRWGAVLALKELNPAALDVRALARLYKTESSESIKRDIRDAVSKLNISTAQWRQELDAP